MTVKQVIKKDHWRLECKISGCRSMEVCVQFLDPKKKSDEAEFYIKPFDVDELQALFHVFCAENGFQNNTVENIYVIGAYPVEPEDVSDYLDKWEGK